MKRTFTLVAFALFIAITQGCTTGKVKIPPPAQDTVPSVTIHALASGGNGQIESPEISYCPTPCQSYVTIGTDLLLTTDANNPGGVQYLSIDIEQAGASLFHVVRTATPDSNNLVPTSLSIVGSNGAGGMGPNPLLAHISTMSAAVKATVTAKNFNGMPKTLVANYVPLGKVKASISASETTVDRGQQVILNYSTENAHYPTDITNYGTANLSGYVSVNPLSNTTYTLIASNFIYKDCTLPNPMQCAGAEQVKKSVSITVRQPPQPPQTQTMRVDLLAQPMGPQGGYQPYVYTFAGNLSLQQIELPTNGGNNWVAAIKLPKLGNSTNDCGDADKIVLLSSGSHTSPQQMKDIYGSESPTISPGGRIIACVVPKSAASLGSTVGVIITYTH